MKTAASEIFRNLPQTDLNWVIFILVLVMTILIIGKLIFENNYAALGNLERFVDVNDNQALFGLSFQIMFSLLLGTLLVPYLNDDYDFIFNTPLLKIVTFSVILMLYFFLKTVVSKIGIYAFKLNFDRMENQKIENYFMTYEVGILFLSVLIFYFSGISRISILLISICIILIINVLRVVKTLARQQVQETKALYYNILYLCALEILPLLVLFKFLTKW